MQRGSTFVFTDLEMYPSTEDERIYICPVEVPIPIHAHQHHQPNPHKFVMLMPVDKEATKDEDVLRKGKKCKEPTNAGPMRRHMAKPSFILIPSILIINHFLLRTNTLGIVASYPLIQLPQPTLLRITLLSD